MGYGINEALFGLRQSKVCVPTMSSLFCLQMAKKRMLEAVYLLYKYIPSSKIMILATDTDSIYIASSEKNWIDCIPIETRNNFLKENSKLQIFPQSIKVSVSVSFICNPYFTDIIHTV
jgi:hypothetical protein